MHTTMPLPSTLHEWNNTNSASSFAVYHHCAWWCFVNNKVHWVSTWSGEYEFRKLFCISHSALSTCCLSPPNYQNWTLCSVSGFLPSSRYWWQFFWGKSQFLQNRIMFTISISFSHTIQDTSKAVCNTKRCTEPQTGFAPVPFTSLKESAMSTEDS
jgi:hypothetical protein